MKVRQFLTALAIFSVLSGTSAMAQTSTRSAQVVKSAQAFASYKTALAKGLERRALEIQKIANCVQAAPNENSLKACFPQRKSGNKNRK